jgi:hypothetical protein
MLSIVGLVIMPCSIDDCPMTGGGASVQEGQAEVEPHGLCT